MMELTEAYFVSIASATKILLIILGVICLFLNNPRSSIFVLGISLFAVVVGYVKNISLLNCLFRLGYIGYLLSSVVPMIDRAVHVLDIPLQPTNGTSQINTTLAPTPSHTPFIDLKSLILSLLLQLIPSQTEASALLNTLLKSFQEPKVIMILTGFTQIDELRISLNALLEITVLFALIMTVVIILVLSCFYSGKYQDFRRKRRQYYKHVQGLLLIGKINQSEGKVSTQQVRILFVAA